MRTLDQVLAEVDRAGVFSGARVDSVHTERLGGETALHIVAKWGDAEAIRVLVAHGADINKAGEDGNTPLHYAVMLGGIDAVKCLVDLGAANLKDRYGCTPSKLAELLEGHESVRRYFVANGF